jgi:hypothetical protein
VRTNIERALNGQALADSAMGLFSSPMQPKDYQDGLVDALTNLRHFARLHDLDFDHAIDTSAMHHREEARFTWDEVPS